MTKIKPCPFCGNQPKMFSEEDPYSPGGPIETEIYLLCGCGATLSGDDLDEEKLIKKWNTRKKIK